MFDKNKKLLDEVINNRLEKALQSDADAEGSNVAFKQAMEAIDRRNELEKIEAAHDEQVEKQKTAKKEAIGTFIIRTIEVGSAILIVPLVNHCFNMRYAKELCNFEKDYTFTTSAGKATSKFFNFFKFKN